MIDPTNKKYVPYIVGNKKTFWGFTSTSKFVRTTYNFLKKGNNFKSGTVFTLFGDIWGYDITLFNYYNEEEILLEPEINFIIDQVYPPLNEIIQIRCQIQYSPMVLDFENLNDSLVKNKNLKYEIIEKLGQNTYDSIFKIKNIHDKKIYIMKKIFLKNLKEKEKEMIEKEINLLIKNNSNYNIKYYDIFQDTDYLNIIMEYLGDCRLKTLIENNKEENKVLDEEKIYKIILKVSLGLKELHDNNIIHGSLTPENISINEDILKIGDFDFAKHLNPLTNSFNYVAPEIINSKNYNSKVDIWSLGCILYELCSSKKCFEGDSFFNLCDNIINKPHKLLCLNNYSKSLQNLLNLMLQKDNDKRPNISDVIYIIKNNITNIEILKELSIDEKIVDHLWNKTEGWDRDKKEERGGKVYHPPLDGWIGIGLKVIDKYDKGNNNWIGHKKEDGEFAVAYYALTSNLKAKEEIINNLNDAINSDFTITKLSYCEEGVLIFQHPILAESYASIIDLNGHSIKILIMCRINPKYIKESKAISNCWILNPLSKEIRPYRILIKKIDLIFSSPVDYIISAIKSNDFSFRKIFKEKEFEKYTFFNGKKLDECYFILNLYESNFGFYRIVNNYLESKKKIIDDNFSESQIKSSICCLHHDIKRIKNIKENTIVYSFFRRFHFSSEIGIGFRGFIISCTTAYFDQMFVENQLDKKGGTFLEITLKNKGENNYLDYCCSLKEITHYPDKIIISPHCSYIITNIERTGFIDYVKLNCEGYLFD